MSCPHLMPPSPSDAPETRALFGRLWSGEEIIGAEDLAKIARQIAGILDRHGKGGEAGSRLAEIVVQAGAGRRAEATLAALSLLPAPVAPLVVSLSEQFALLAQAHLRAGGGL